MSTLKVNSIQNVSSIQNASGNIFALPSTPVQTVVNRYTGSITTSSSTLASFFSTSITTKTTNPIIMCYLHVKQRVDNSSTWNLAYIQVVCSGTTVMYSGYNGANCNGWIHDYTAEKPYYATGNPGTTFTFTCNVASYSGTNYINTPGQSADDGYAIMQLTEIAP